MKKAILIGFAILSLFLTGCMNIKVDAPEGKVIKLGRKAETEKLQPTMKKTVYYALWGLAPISNNSTEDLLTNVDEKSKVVIETHLTGKDILVNIFGGLFSIASQTVSVEEQE